MYLQSMHIILMKLYSLLQQNFRYTRENDKLSLLLLQTFNAKQLTTWCLHFISTNYDSFTRRAEFSQLTGSNLEHCSEHRWPPLSYLNELQEYEQKLKATGNKELIDRCSVM